MPAPSKNWTDIADTAVDADSPLDATLMTNIRDNCAFLKDWMGGAYVPYANNPHDHDGVNSAPVVVPNGTITPAKLKLTQGSFSTASAGTFYFSIDRYAHYPSLARTMSTYLVQLFNQTDNATGASEVRKGTLVTAAGNSHTHTVYWDYHAA